MVKVMSGGSKDCEKHSVPDLGNRLWLEARGVLAGVVLRRLPGGGDVQAEIVACSRYGPGDRREHCESRGIVGSEGH